MTTKTLRWTESAVNTLKACFDTTDWCIFRDSWTTLDEYTDTVSEYIRFCVELCIPTKTVTKHPNNKRWYDKTIRKKIVLKDRAYRLREKDPASYSSAKNQLRLAIRQHKTKYKNKLEDVFRSGDSKTLWSHMSDITQYKGSKRSIDNDDPDLPDQLNSFYARFDRDNKTVPVSTPVDEATPPPFVITTDEVRHCFNSLNVHKSAGPDGIKPKFLKLCSSELSHVFTNIFNWSLEICTVPACFKKSVIVPVPKKASPSCLNDYRPVALTSVTMKCFEKLVLKFINSLLPNGFDPHQFAYRPKRNIDDAISINVHDILQHCENKNTYARVLFIDYSSAFNTIIPCKLYSKLMNDLHFPVTLCNWVLNFLLNRPQVVKVGTNISSTIVLNTGTPQGCPVSPKLYSLFTFDCQAIYSGNTVIKFADDTTVTGLISDNNEHNYRSEIQHIVDWCDTNNLFLNVNKTKEMIIDFRRNKTTIEPITIKNIDVEQVSSFKFLGTHVCNDLSWNVNCTTL